jgi:hypothetical protein
MSPWRKFADFDRRSVEPMSNRAGQIMFTAAPATKSRVSFEINSAFRRTSTNGSGLAGAEARIFWFGRRVA